MSHIPALIQRVVDALPLNSQRPFQFVESDELLAQYVASLVELALSDFADLQEVLNELLLALDRLHRPAQLDTVIISQLLNSQIFLLRATSTIARRAADAMHQDPASALDSNLVQRALSCSMAIYLQASLIQRWVASSEVNPILLVPRSQKTSLVRSSTSTTLSRSSTGSTEPKDFQHELKEQETLVCDLLSFVSSSNWAATYDRIETMLRNPYVEDFEEEFNQKLRFLAHIELSAYCINKLLSLVSGCITILQKSTQLVLIECLTSCLSEWLKKSPCDVMKVCIATKMFRTPKGLELFDYLLHFADNSKKKAIVWPFLSILVSLYPIESADKSTRPFKKNSYLQALAKTGEAKLVHIVLRSYTIILYAASHLDLSLRLRLSPLLLDIRAALSTRESQLAECVDLQTFDSPEDLFVSMYRLHVEEYNEFATKLLVSWLEGHDRHQIAAIRSTGAVLQAYSRENALSSSKQLIDAVCPLIRLAFIKAAEYSSPSNGYVEANSHSGSLLLRTILELYSVVPDVLFTIQLLDSYEDVIDAITRCLRQESVSVASPAGKLVLEVQKWTWIEGLGLGAKRQETLQIRWTQWVKLSAETIRALVVRLTSRSLDTQGMRLLLELLQSCITERTRTLQRYPQFLVFAADAAIHEALIDLLEVSLLNLTSHVDYLVATQAARACYLVLAAAEAYYQLTQRKVDTLQNSVLYEAIGQTTFLTMGRNAVQRKIRTCLRSGTHTLNLRRAWLQTFDRWERLTDILLRAQQSGVEAEEHAQLEWQNHTGFLAALARPEDGHDNASVLKFIGRFREVFVHGGPNSALIGEASAEILGSDLHLSLSLPMLHEVQYLIGTMRDKKGVLIVRSRHTMLAEHLITLCRGLFERLESFLGTRDALDIGRIFTDLAEYLQTCGQSHLRCRLRYCQFIAFCAPRLDLICIEGILPIARRLSNYLANWVSPVVGQNREGERISREINTACLKALANLTKDLHFVSEPISSMTQVFGDVKDLIHFVLPLLQMTDEQCSLFSTAPHVPLIQEMLSNLLAVNQRSSFTTYVSLCYSEDIRVSTVFASTIISRLEKGIDTFRSKSQAEIVPNLWRVVLEDNDLLITLLDGLSQNSLTEMIFSLCEDQGKTQELFATVVETELQMVSQESELYRRNSPTTRLFALFVHKHASAYIESTLRGPLSTLEAKGDNFSMELDITKLEVAAEWIPSVLDENRRNLEATASQFIDAICDSAEQIPPQLVRVLRIVAEKTATKYPNSVHKSVGSFLILRMLGPAIMKQMGHETIPRMRRQVLVVVKLLTNLANNTFFKEDHMVGVNSFLSDNIVKLSKFLENVTNPDLDRQTHLASWRESPPSVSSLSPQGVALLNATLVSEGDRIRMLWIQRKMKRGMTVDAIRVIVRYLTSLVKQLSETGSQRNAIAKTTSPQSETLRAAGLPSTLAPNAGPKIDALHMVGFSRAGRPVLYVGVHDLQLLSSPLVDPIATAIQNLTSNYNRNDVEVFIDLTDSAGALQETSLKQMFITFLTGKVVQHCHTIYLHNVNHCFWSLMKEELSQSIMGDPTKAIFLDHSLDLEHYFDTVVCARLTAMHGQLIRTCPDALFIHDGLQGRVSDWSYRLTVHRNEVFCFSTIQKHEIFPSQALRSVETVRLADVKDIQITNDLLSIVLEHGRIIQIRTKDVTTVSRYLKFALLELKTSALHYREEANNSEEIVRGLLLCLGLLKVVSRDIRTRELGATILLKLLPTKDLLERGLFKHNVSNMALMDNGEIYALHEIARRYCTGVTQVAFLQELISRIPHIGHLERRTTLPSFYVWLTGLSDVLGSNLIEPETQVRTIVSALIDMHNPTEDSRLAMFLWGVLAQQPLLKDLIFDSLCSSALMFDHTSLQVSNAVEIFRMVRNPFFISKITDTLVERLNKRYSVVPNLMHTEVWPEIEVLLRILVELTARATKVFINLPKILYVFGCILKLGPLGVRELSFQLIINAVSGSFCDTELPAPQRDHLRDVLLNLESDDLRANILLETTVLSQKHQRGTGQHTKQFLEVAAMMLMKILAELMIKTLKLSATSKAQETAFLKDYLTLITDAAFHRTVMSRRAFVILGVLSAELEVDLTTLLLDGLAENLPSTSSQDCRQTIAIIISLSLSRLEDPAKILKLSLALCAVPLPPVAIAGLHLLMRCLELLTSDQSSDAIDECFSAYDPTWFEYQKSIGVSVSSQRSLGISCILVRNMRITGSWDLSNRVSLRLIRMYTNMKTEENQSFHILPMLALLCAQANNNQEIDAALANGPQDLQSKNEGDLVAYLRRLNLDDNFGTILLSLISDLFITTDNPLQQISLISLMIATSWVQPHIFLMVFKDLEQFLGQLLAESTHLPFLHAVWDLIKAQKRIVATSRYREASQANLLPTKGERLRQLGFEYLAVPHTSGDSTNDGDIAAHSARIAKILASIT